MPYVAIRKNDLIEASHDKVLDAFAQAQASPAGGRDGMVFYLCQQAPDEDLWEASGVPVLCRRESRDGVERFVAAMEGEGESEDEAEEGAQEESGGESEEE